MQKVNAEISGVQLETPRARRARERAARARDRSEKEKEEVNNVVQQASEVARARERAARARERSRNKTEETENVVQEAPEVTRAGERAARTLNPGQNEDEENVQAAAAPASRRKKWKPNSLHQPVSCSSPQRPSALRRTLLHQPVSCSSPQRPSALRRTLLHQRVSCSSPQRPSALRRTLLHQPVSCSSPQRPSALRRTLLHQPDSCCSPQRPSALRRTLRRSETAPADLGVACRCDSLGVPSSLPIPPLHPPDSQAASASSSSSQAPRQLVRASSSADVGTSSRPASQFSFTHRRQLKRSLPDGTPTRPAKERRLARWRSTCSVATSERMGRALEQRMYLLEQMDLNSDHGPSKQFEVLGSTGNAYTVRIGALVSCSCPDALKGFVCKHQLFVFLRVLRAPRSSALIYQRALLSSERVELFAAVRSFQAETNAVAIQPVREAYKESKNPRDPVQHRGLASDDCPICYEELAQEALKVCKTCRNAVHEACLTKWSLARVGRVSCPSCRENNWDQSQPRPLMREGYLNFGDVAGLPAEREYTRSRQWL
eukprot:TRINITY_DN26147_c0_g1_i2.p1 TRINITY_DN26147_c0_g1~~TRINITY_DN26147_c0_g1_i2.p1  ORF type:complete len:547 (+),score=21.67 TRINITY_DN26147_c0_g1_i2:196-1836(+)